MPNLVNDKDIDEIEFKLPLDAQRIHYVDYYQPKYLSNGSLFPKDSNILDNLKPSYVMPETIKFIGHWNDSGFIVKYFVIKTELDTEPLLIKHLRYLPTNNPTVGTPVNLTCMMYDFYAQIELRTGFGDLSNKRFVVHLHRGFSRHCRRDGAVAKFFGDYYGDITVNNTTNFGIYEHAFNVGFEYFFKGLRGDNIYSSDKYEIEDANLIPPKKILDIYETLSAPIESRFNISIKEILGYKQIKRISSFGELASNFFIDGELVLSNELFTNITYTYNGSGNLLARPDYTMRLYVKIVGEDGRVLDPLNASKRKGYQKFSFGTNYWNNKGEIINGFLNLKNNNQVYIQNKDNLKIAPIRLLLNSSTVNVGTSAGKISNFNPISLNFKIEGQYSSGYLELSDKRNSTEGAKICHVKKLRIKTEAYFYDGDYNTEKGELRFRLYTPLTSSETANKLNYLTMSPNEFKTLEFYNLDSFAYISQYSYKTDETLLFRENFIQSDTKNYRSFKNLNKKQKVYLRLYDNKEVFQNRQYNVVDFPEDGRMIFRGEALPAFVYNRKPELNLKDIVTIRGSGNPPINSIETRSLNAYRYLKYELKLQSGPNSVPHRVTIWESTGIGVTSRYFDRKADLSYDNVKAQYLDLMFPDFPGTKYDTQDDPYPRLSGNLSDLEKTNSPYYGCNRVLRIDIDSLSTLNTVDFSCKAVVGDVNSANGIDIARFDRLRFNPPSDQDFNYKRLNTSDNTEGRRFLLMWHGHKPEEETDIIKSDSGIKLLNTNEFVERLNTLHSGLDCKVLNNIQITLTQGQHYRHTFDNKIRKQNVHTIDKFYDSVEEINLEETDQNVIYYSEIYDGVYLDFPPFIQDFNNTDQADSWTSNSKRRDSNSSYHLDLRSYVSLRGKVYGHNDFDSDTSIPRSPDIQRRLTVNEKVNNITVRKDSRSEVEGPELYKTGAIYPKYDIGNQSFNSIGVIFRGENWESLVKILSNKMTRVTFGRERPYIPNPYILPVASNYFYFSAAESKIKNEVSIVFGQTFNPLNPFSPKPNKNTNSDGLIRIATFNSYTLSAYDLSLNQSNSEIKDIFGYSPNLLNQNIPINNGFYILSETYKFTDPKTKQINPQSLVLYNYSIDDKNSWVYYDNQAQLISKAFDVTENNSYAISPNLRDLFCLGVFSNSLILQSLTLDMIAKSESDQTINVNPPIFSALIDGENLSTTGKQYFPEILPIPVPYSSPGKISKFSSVACVDSSNIVCFYNFDNILNSLYFKTLINLQLSERKVLFNSSSLANNSNYVISNYTIIYDDVQKLFRCVFLVSLNQSNICIFYTEFDYNSGAISNPNIFHFIAGLFNSSDFKMSSIFTNGLNTNINLPYQKPAIVIYNNSDLKGQIGIFFVNNNGNLSVINIKPFLYSSELKELK